MYTTAAVEKQAHPCWIGSVEIQLRPSLAVLAFEDTVVVHLASWRWGGSSAAAVVVAVVDDVWRTTLT